VWALSAVREIGTDGSPIEGRFWLVWLIILGGGFAMLQAPVLNGFSFDFSQVSKMA
jgi:hypothetical protein